MTAFMIATVTARPGADLSWVPDYGVNVGWIAKLYGGEYIGISKVPPGVDCLEGTETPPQFISLGKFPSVDHIRRFLESPEYAPHKANRMANCDGGVIGFENEDDAPNFKTER